LGAASHPRFIGIGGRLYLLDADIWKFVGFDCNWAPLRPTIIAEISVDDRNSLRQGITPLRGSVPVTISPEVVMTADGLGVISRLVAKDRS
jgi:hypothetical protein